MQRYLQPQDKAGITHLDIPEWDKLFLFLVIIFGLFFNQVPSLQWWLAISYDGIFLNQVDWRFHFLDWVSYRCVVIKEDMDKALFEKHVCHFSQATGTPFTVNPLLSQFRELEEKQAGVQFCTGTLDLTSSNVNDITQELLAKLQQQPSDPPEIDTSLTAHDICCNYKHWKESTSTAHSGHYLSLYKTWINIPEEMDDDYT
eukprot:15342879-Ditylum_brightwellii.AAC.1